MRVLITGGAGFLGSNLCERLLNEGHDVLVVDNLLTGKLDNIQHHIGKSNFSFAACGIETKAFLDACESTSARFNRIYHLACPTGVPNIEILGEEMLAACSDGTRQVLKVAVSHGAELLFTSSSEIYGEPLQTPQGEDYTGNVDPIGPRARYEEGKRFSETLVAHFVHRYGLRAMTVRLFNVYGPRMSTDDTRVVPCFMKQALTNAPLTVQGEGNQSRTMCFVTDILDGFEAVLTNGFPGEIYNLGSDQSVTMRELADMVIDITGAKSGIVSVPRPAHDHSSRMPVLKKIHSLGWRRKVDLPVGLMATLDYFKAQLAPSSDVGWKESVPSLAHSN
jgi:nucleoside-diphosphate-sugar epimerase